MRVRLDTERVLELFRQRLDPFQTAGCEVQVQVDAAADSVALFRRAGGTATSCGGGAFIEAVTSPGTNTNYLITASANADVTSGLTIAFDSIGRPSPAGGSVVISGRTILVEAESGYVH